MSLSFAKGAEVGHGMLGTVYETVPKSDYVIKIEHVLEKAYRLDNSNKMASRMWRENEFSEFMSSKYPDYFLRIMDYRIDEDCKHKQDYSYNPKYFGKKDQQGFLKLAQSKYCIERIYQRVNVTLNQIDWNLFNSIHLDIDDYKGAKLYERTLQMQMNYYSLLVQLLYSVKLLKQHGYVHSDIHTGNIGIKFTNSDDIINIMGYNIPTFGKRYILIDYGEIRNMKYLGQIADKKLLQKTIMSDRVDYYFNPEFDENISIMNLVIYNEFFNYYFKYRVNFQSIMRNWNKLNSIIPIYYNNVPDNPNIVPKLEPISQRPERIRPRKNVVTVDWRNRCVELQLYALYYPKLYNSVMPAVSDRSDFKVSKYLPDEDYSYFAVNWFDNDNLIKYFATKLAKITASNIELARPVLAYAVMKSGGKLDCYNCTQVNMFQIGACSKFIVNLVVAKLVELGKIKYSDMIGQATLEQYLTHMSGETTRKGYQGYNVNATLPTNAEIIKGCRFDKKAGKECIYSGCGYQIVQQFLEARLNQTLAALIRYYIFDPLKLVNASTDLNPANIINYNLVGYRLYPELAACGIWMSCGDLYTILDDIIECWHGRGILLRRDTVKSGFIRSKGSEFSTLGYLYDPIRPIYRFHPQGKMMLGCEGQNDGYKVMFYCIPETKFIKVMMANYNKQLVDGTDNLAKYIRASKLDSIELAIEESVEVLYKRFYHEFTTKYPDYIDRLTIDPIAKKSINIIIHDDNWDNSDYMFIGWSKKAEHNRPCIKYTSMYYGRELNVFVMSQLR